MTMWIIIMWSIIALVVTALFYLGARVPSLFVGEWLKDWSAFKQFSLGLLICLGFFGVVTLCIDFVNAVVCVIYLAIIWGISDLVWGLIEKFGLITLARDYSGWMAILFTAVALGWGWYCDHQVWQTDYELTTDKNIGNLKIAMFADSHIGTTFDDVGFAQHLQKIEAQQPDAVVVVGDYVDDGTTREQMINATRALGRLKTKYGVYYVAGNHDKGYYGAAHRGFSGEDLFNELTQNGVKVLRDESILVDERFYIIGRRDFSEVKEQGGSRRSIENLLKDLDYRKYMLVLDHQPVEYNQDAQAGVDLVLSGHTHGGQLWPFNRVGKWIKANDMIYGYEKRQNTDFIVTSGISDWAIKFKTGTRSEFVVLNIRQVSQTHQQ